MKLLSSLMLVFCTLLLQAQVYQTEELKNEAEQQISKKQKPKQLVNSVTGIVLEVKLNPLKKSDIKNTFQLISIKAIDKETKHSKEEMKTFQQESEIEFLKTDIRITNNLDKMYFISKEDNSKYSVKEIEVNGKLIQYLNCTKCADFNFYIVSNTGDELILETDAQDEGSYYTTRLILKK